MNKPKLADYITRIPVTATPDQSIAYARGLMHEHRIRHLPIVDDSGVVGLVSQRDLLLLDSIDPESDDLPLSRTVNGKPYTVDVASDLAAIAREMCARHIGSAVVTRDGVLVGMFTTTDALGALAAALDS